jgi:hypothetical protein
MEYRNNMVGSPVKTYEVNDLIGELNAQVRRPCLYTMFCTGYSPVYNTDYTGEGLFTVPLPILKPPIVTYEIAAVGRRAIDAGTETLGCTGVENGTTIANQPRVCGMFRLSPSMLITKSTGGGTSIANTNTATKFCSYDLNRSMPIEVGASITEDYRGVMNPNLFSETPTGTNVRAYNLFLHFAYVRPPANERIYDDTAKLQPETIMWYYAPSYILNITVEFGED